MRKPYYIIASTSAGLILLFVYTGISKWIESNQFEYILSRSPFIGGLAAPLAITIPVAELLLAALLFFPRTRPQGLLLSSILMLSFSLYIAAMLLWSPHLPCSCGGVLNSIGWKTHLVFNIAVTLLASWGWYLSRSQARFDSNALCA